MGRRYKIRGMRFKLLLYFVVLISLPLITLGVMGNMVSTRVLENEANRHTVQMMEQVKKNVDSNLKDIENMITLLSKEPQVIRFLDVSPSSNPELIRRVTFDIQTNLRNYKQVHPDVAGILIVNRNDMDYSDDMHRLARDPLIHEAWYQQAIREPDAMHLISKPIGRNLTAKAKETADEVLSVVKALRDPVSGIYKGVILVDYRLDSIEAIINEAHLGKSGFMIITEKDGEIVYAPIHPVALRIRPEWGSPGMSEPIVKTIRDQKYQIIFRSSDYTGWQTIGVFSLDETLEEVASVRDFAILLGGITLLLSAGAAVFFTNSIVKPAMHLRKLMKRVEGGDLQVRFESKASDEIGQLGIGFNNMIGEIRKLIDMVYVEQKSKRKAELKALQAQIKPHFLYNTLETIQWMAEEREAGDIAETVSALTRLFRISLSKGKELIPAGDEINHICSYLLIQKMRYEEKLAYSIEMLPGIERYSVIKLILQPIVENAIYHGLKARKGPGRIEVKAYLEDGIMTFEVSDNGAGMEPDRLKEIRSRLSSPYSPEETSGYGLFNVNERIQLRYGSSLGIAIDSKPGEGTVVKVRHPLIEGE